MCEHYRRQCARNHLQVPCHFGSGGWSYVMYAQQYFYMMYAHMMHAYMMHAYTKYAYMMYAYMMYAEPHGDGFESDVGSRASAGIETPLSPLQHTSSSNQM